MFRKGGGATSPALIQPGRVKEISSRFDRVKADVVDRVLASRPAFYHVCNSNEKYLCIYTHMCAFSLSLAAFDVGSAGWGGASSANVALQTCVMRLEVFFSLYI